jgi:hypothetical protein
MHYKDRACRTHEEKTNAYKILVEKLEGRDLGVVRRRMIKLILNMV